MKHILVLLVMCCTSIPMSVAATTQAQVQGIDVSIGGSTSGHKRYLMFKLSAGLPSVKLAFMAWETRDTSILGKYLGIDYNSIFDSGLYYRLGAGYTVIPQKEPRFSSQLRLAPKIETGYQFNRFHVSLIHIPEVVASFDSPSLTWVSLGYTF